MRTARQVVVELLAGAREASTSVNRLLKRPGSVMASALASPACWFIFSGSRHGLPVPQVAAAPS
jgi:hypothetical protein